MSKPQRPLSLGARLSVGALALLGCVVGWLVVPGAGAVLVPPLVHLFSP